MRIEVYLNTTDYNTASEFAAMLRDVYPDDVNSAVVVEPEVPSDLPKSTLSYLDNEAGAKAWKEGS